MTVAGGHVPEEHVVTVTVVADPANLNLVFVPSVGTVIVMVHEGRAVKLCWFPSNAIVAGLTEQPVSVPVDVGTPLATEIVSSSVTEGTTVNVDEAVLPTPSTPVTV